MERQFKGIWIPAEIWLDEKLTVMEKVLYAEIDSFCGNGKECFCSNAHFAKMLQVSERRVQQILTAMENKGVITRTVIYKEGTKEVERRYLKPTYFTTPPEENFMDTNTVFTNPIITKEEEEEAAWQKVLRCYQDNIHPITSRVQLDKLHELLKDYGGKWVCKAIAAAALHNGRSISYLTATLEAWERKGFKEEKKTEPEQVKPLAQMTREEALAYYAEKNRLEMERLARERAM